MVQWWLAIQFDVALWLVPLGPMVTGAVKGGGWEQFELLLVVIDYLEEPSHFVWPCACLQKYVSNQCYLFWHYGW